MRSRQAVGRPGTPVIPSKWSQAPRVVIEKTWTACVEIRHPGGTKGAFNATTGTYPATPHEPHFTGDARIQVLNAQERSQLIAEDPVTTVGYRVVVGLDASEVAVEDVVKITGVDDNGDPTLINHELILRSFDRGSLAWERDLICTDNLG